MAKISDQELISKLANAASQGVNAEGDELSDTRERLLAKYRGKYEEKTRGKNYSNYKNRDIFETVEWLLAPMMKAFISHHGIVNFDAVNERDEPQAEFESKVVNNLIFKANDGDGFLAIYNFCKDALLYPNAYAMVDAETITETLTREANDVAIEEIAQLQQDEAIELTEASEPQQLILDGQPLEVYDITYKETRERVKLVVMCLPPEDVIVNKTADSIQLKDAELVAIRMKKTHSDLIKMGYDKKKLDKIKSKEDIEDMHHSEKVQRLFYAEQEEIDWNREQFTEADRELMLWRFWLNIDYDGDGVSEFRQIDIAGDQVLENKGADFCTVVSMSTIPVPHTHAGMSPAQSVEPIEELKNAVYRQMMDSVYKSEVGKTFVNMRGIIPNVTTNALHNRLSEFVYVQGPPSEHVLPTNPTPLTNELIPLINLLDELIPLRTGVTPRNSTNPALMQNVKTGAVEGALKKATERVELIIKIAAETGMKSIARLAHQLCRKYPELVRNIKIEGQWREVKAEDWIERYTVTANTGLGVNDANESIARMMPLGDILEKLSGQGLVNAQKMYNFAKKFIEPLGIGAPEMFLVDPQSEDFQPPQPPPDPNMIVAEATAKDIEYKNQHKQAEIQMQQTKSQADAQGKMADVQVKMQELQLKAEKNPAEIEKIFAEIKSLLAEVQRENAALSGELDEARATAELKRAQAVAARRQPAQPTGGR